MRAQRFVCVIALFLALTKVTCSSSSLNTQEVTAERNGKVEDNPQPGNPPSGTSGENSGQTPPEKPGDTNGGQDKTEKPGDGNADEDKTQQPGDDETSSTSTTSKSSRLSHGLAISFSSLLISFLFYI